MEDELGYDPRAFIIVDSVWHVIDESTFDVVQEQATDDRWYVTVFSDSDLAERFIKRTQKADYIAVEVKSPLKWLEFLKTLRKAGYVYIAIDPEPKTKLRIAPIESVIERVERSINQQR